METQFVNNIQLQAKTQLTNLLNNVAGIPKDTLMKLSKSEFNQLSAKYLGATLDDTIDSATDVSMLSINTIQSLILKNWAGIFRPMLRMLTRRVICS